MLYVHLRLNFSETGYNNVMQFRSTFLFCRSSFLGCLTAVSSVLQKTVYHIQRIWRQRHPVSVMPNSFSFQLISEDTPLEPCHTFRPYCLRTNSNIILPPYLGLANPFLYSPYQNFVCILLSTRHATCPTLLILLHLIISITFRGEYKL
jgi:hypothetical protein